MKVELNKKDVRKGDYVVKDFCCNNMEDSLRMKEGSPIALMLETACCFIGLIYENSSIRIDYCPFCGKQIGKT